jgi:hypothetical protein
MNHIMQGFTNLLLLLLLLVLLQVGTPRTHRRYLSREDGTYGPIPSRRPLGMLSMPFNSTSVQVSYLRGMCVSMCMCAWSGCNWCDCE